jgi:hypothetical protein
LVRGIHSTRCISSDIRGKGDEDAERRTQAEVLLNAYKYVIFWCSLIFSNPHFSRELERLRQRVGLTATFSGINEAEEEDNSSSDESFHYPTASSPTSTARAASIRSHATGDYFNLGASTSMASSSRGGTVDLTPQLSQAPEFRVPTHEAPQKVTPRWTPPSPHSMQPVWERDGAAPDCRNCKRRFTFLLRKHVGTTSSRLAAEYSLSCASTAENVARYSATDARPIGLCLIPRTLFRIPHIPTRLCTHQRSIEFVIPATSKSPPMYPVGSKACERAPWRESWSSLHRSSESREIDRIRLRRLATLLSRCRDPIDLVLSSPLF